MSVEPTRELRATRHARKRWRERFPDFDMQGQFWAARRATKRTVRRATRLVRKHTYLLKAPCGAVFVCGFGGLVLTVLPEPTP